MAIKDAKVKFMRLAYTPWVVLRRCLSGKENSPKMN